MHRDFKDSEGKVIPESLKKVMCLINTIPVSTAECERGFSRLSLICISLRSLLTVKHMSSLMFLSLSGPPLALWKPLSYVKSWLASSRREATCKQCHSKINTATFETDSLLSLWNTM